MVEAIDASLDGLWLFRPTASSYSSEMWFLDKFSHVLSLLSSLCNSPVNWSRKFEIWFVDFVGVLLEAGPYAVMMEKRNPQIESYIIIAEDNCTLDLSTDQANYRLVYFGIFDDMAQSPLLVTYLQWQAHSQLLFKGRIWELKEVWRKTLTKKTRITKNLVKKTCFKSQFIKSTMVFHYHGG